MLWLNEETPYERNSKLKGLIRNLISLNDLSETNSKLKGPI